MQPIEEALRELKQKFLQLDLVNVALDTGIAFLSLLFIFLLFKFPWYYSFIAFFASLGYYLYKEYSKNRLIDVEQEVPELNEQLRTAADNISLDNSIVNMLKQDVLKNLKKVRLSYFLDYRHLLYKMTGLFCLSFLVVFIAYMNVGFNFNFVTDGIFGDSGGGKSGPDPENIKIAYRDGNLSNILGEVSVVQLGNEELNLEINPTKSEININEISEAGNEEFVAPQFPKEIYTSYDNAYKDQVPKQNQKIVKEYFKNLAGE